MLSKNNPVTLNTQVAMLHSISAVFEQLTQVLPTVEVTRLASSMLESLPTRDISPQLTQAKLTAIKNMVSSQLFYEDGEYLNIFRFANVDKFDETNLIWFVFQNQEIYF